MQIFRGVTLTLAILAPVSAWAQSADTQTASSDSAQVSRWSVGLGIAVFDNAYVGRGTQVLPIPMVQYQGNRLFMNGISGGVHLLKDDAFSIDAVLSPGLNQMPAKDFNRTELAERGIDRDALDNRDISVLAGFSAAWHGSAGRLQLDAKADIAGSAGGAVYSLKYSYPFQLWGFRVAPTLGVDFLSSQMADYYYGIHADEQRRGVPAYSPGGSMIPGAGVSLMRPLGKKWSLLINGQFNHLPEKISDSPLVSGSQAGSVYIGVSRAL